MNITKKNPTTGAITLDAAAFQGISQETIDREIRSFDPFAAAVERLYAFEHNTIADVRQTKAMPYLQKAREVPATAAKAIEEYENTIAPITMHIRESIIDWCDATEPEVVIYAIQEAAANNKCNWKYAETIIRSHYNAGRKTLKAIQTATKQYKRSKQSRASGTLYESKEDHESIEALMHKKFDG